MSLYDDQWSTRREPITVPCLGEEPDEEDEDTAVDWDTREPRRWEIVSVLLYLLFMIAFGLCAWPR